MKIIEELEAIKIGSLSLSSLLSAIVLFIICLIVIKLLSRFIARLLNGGKYLPVNIKGFLLSAIKGLLWVIAALIVLDALGIPITSFVALLSVVGLALSLSIQGILGNLFSGITLLVAKPIAVGDYVEVGGNAGTVRTIGMFYTVIATKDNKLIYLPNGDVTSSKIINHFCEGTRRIETVISASYNSPTELVHKAVYEAAAAEEKILGEPAPYVCIQSYGSSNIDYIVRVWVKSEDFWEISLSLNERLREAFDRNGVAIDYDHINVHTIK